MGAALSMTEMNDNVLRAFLGGREDYKAIQ